MSELQPVRPDYIFSTIFYQQCFYQGIPIYLIRDKYIPYTQLPHISINNYKILKDKNTDITIDKFFNFGENEKKEFIKKMFNFTESEIKDIIESTKSIPHYECKIKSFVDGYENTGFLKGDRVTFKLDITRKNEEDKKMGVQHSKCYPELFSEFLYILISTKNNLIKFDKIFIDKKQSEYEFFINIGYAGILPLQIMVIPATVFQPNIVINCELKCFERSQKREEMIKIIEDKNKNEKYEPSLIQRLFLNYHNLSDDDDDDEEEEDDGDEKNKNKDKTKKNIKSKLNEENINDNIEDIDNNNIINNIEINNEIENNENEIKM